MSDPCTIDYKPIGKNGRAMFSVKYSNGDTLTDRIDVVSEPARVRFLDKLCKDRPQLDRAKIGEELNTIAAALAARPDPDDDDADDPPAPTREELLRVRNEETEAALDAMPESAHEDADRMLSAPNLIDLVLADIAALGVVGEELLAATAYLIGTSRLDDKPLAGIVQGQTSTGKSFVPMTTGRFFPDEAVLNATDITANALFYMQPGTLMHRWIIAGERPRNEDDERADATRALREMIASGELSKMVTVKAPDGKGFLTQHIRQPGPIAFIESTTAARIFDEDANRCLLLGTDELEEQTARIVREQARRGSGIVSIDTGPIITRHHALQRMLQRVKVVIPFAELIADAMPTKRQEARRAMPHVLSMIRAVAILHQRQRAKGELHHGDPIKATLTDYVIARRLLVDPMGRALGGALPGAVERFGQWIVDTLSSENFTSREALKDGPVGSKGKASEYLRALADAGVIECIEPHRGAKPAIWKVIGPVPEGGAVWLPTVDRLGGAV